MEMITQYSMDKSGVGAGWLVCLPFANTNQHNENTYTRSLELYMYLLASVKAGVPLLLCKDLWAR